MSSDGTTPIQDPTAATTEPVDIGHARQLGAAPPEGSMGEKVGIRLRNPTDIPVPGRYGTGKRTDFAVWRPSDGAWRVIDSATLQTRTIPAPVAPVANWGQPGDVPV